MGSTRRALLCIFVSLLVVVYSSEGDVHPYMAECRTNCYSKMDCKSSPNVFDREAPFYLKLMLWNCVEDCEYQCMRNHTKERIQQGLRVYQYKGKWPFLRVLGFQEIASSLFSIGNLVNPIVFLFRYWNNIPKNYQHKQYYLALCVFAMLAWWWSAVFHARDFYFTERMDYYFADLYVFFLTPLTIRKVFNIPTLSYLSQILCAIWYLRHVYSMEFIHFDYAYNTFVGIFHLSFQTIVWGYWIKKNWERPVAKKMLISYAVLWMGGMMELFDFPPILDIFDAHSLWHLSTIFSGYFLFEVLEEDALSENKEWWRQF